MIQGQKFRVYGYFKDEAGNLADPTNVFFRAKIGSATVVSYTYGIGSEIVKQTTGTYYVDVDTTSFFGEYAFRWHCAGNIQTTQSRQSVQVEKADP